MLTTRNKWIFGLIVVILVVGGIRLLSGQEDAWLCQNGHWVKHGNPQAAMPATGCGQQTAQVASQQDPANITYEIEGQPVALKNGQAVTTGDAGTITTKLFQATEVGDINGDGQPDTAVILTQELGGSGTFYYAAAAVKTDQGYQGTDAVLLGDRIAPQSMQMQNQTLVVNYADRKPGESFSVPPSVATSAYLEYYNGKLIKRPEALQVSEPHPYQVVTSPLKISGQARGSWFFEGSFPVLLTDWDGKIIAQGQAQAQGEWTTTNFVPFTATLKFTKPSVKNNGTLILKKDNPSGLPQNDAAFEMPVVFQ